MVALPAENLYAKMDLPLVLIEAMLLERAGADVAKARRPPSCARAAPRSRSAEARGHRRRASRACSATPDERAALGARARAAALERYHPAVVAAAYETLYDELLR